MGVIPLDPFVTFLPSLVPMAQVEFVANLQKPTMGSGCSHSLRTLVYVWPLQANPTSWMLCALYWVCLLVTCAVNS
jgi:hypothetical protein